MVSIPTVEDGFLFATRNGAYLVERTLGVVGFSGCMKVKCLEINCVSGFAIFLGTHDHAMAPGHRLADGYRLKATSWSRPALTWDCQCSGTGIGVWWAVGSAIGSTIKRIGLPSSRGSGWCLHVLNVLEW